MRGAPALHRPCTQERGDSLVFSTRPRLSWPWLGIHAFLLAGSTVGGVAASTALWHEGWGDRAFLGVWLSGWAAFETVLATFVAWQLFGRQELVAAADHLEVRQRIGLLARVTTDPLEVQRRMGPLARVVGVPFPLVDSVRASEVEDMVALPAPWRYEVARRRCTRRAGATGLAVLVAAVAVALVLHDRDRGSAGSPPRRADFSGPRPGSRDACLKDPPAAADDCPMPTARALLP